MKPAIRKIVTYIENTLIEGGKAAPQPLRLIGVAAVLTNPWAGRGFTDDLSPEIRAIAPILGEMLTREIVAVAGSGEAIEGYGKAAICGTSGEIEHASALIHTLHFGNHYRRAVGAKTYLAFKSAWRAEHADHDPADDRTQRPPTRSDRAFPDRRCPGAGRTWWRWRLHRRPPAPPHRRPLRGSERVGDLHG